MHRNVADETNVKITRGSNGRRRAGTREGGERVASCQSSKIARLKKREK